MKKYEHQLSLRLPKQISDGLTQICQTYQINESDYVRRSLAEKLRNDLRLSTEEQNRLQYVTKVFVCGHVISDHVTIIYAMV